MIPMLLSALLGATGTFFAVFQWGNNFLKGGYNLLAWPQGWLWPLLLSLFLNFILFLALKRSEIGSIKLVDFFVHGLLPYLAGALMSAVALYLLLRNT